MASEGGNPASGDKPAVLIIGGLGYTGRHLTKYLYDNKLTSEIRIVDKQLPELAWLAPEFKEACSRERFIQADASQERSLPRIFDRANGKEFDYVFNCGGEKRYSQEEKVYELRTYGLSMAVGREAAKRKIKCFVEKSTGMVYKSDSVARKETDKLKPTTAFAKWKLKAEEDLAKIDGLNLVVLRAAHVYGPYANKFIATLLCMARVYQSKGKEMKWLWKEDMKTNTVHVDDMVRAMWHAAEWYMKGPQGRRPAPVFNLADHGNTSQGTSARLAAEIFKIETGFHGTLISAFARLNLDHVVDEVNDETLDPWADLQNAAGISHSTPLSPFMEKELLRDESLNLDGSAFERETGFTYTRDHITKEEVEKVIDSYKRMGWWP
ncbi:NAD dependent epimerase/dehydratase family protein [Dothidotthia symphoricarpi CBS 119687]|uniref:NAD dependent epimerase/dehydratase family protein n=1 Tax=Dothidotthia symphoricarpi CBS 119687 TaxID=1392245 RepID=A0A6A6ANN6_9PLEO|nr:NAD dependent epimerase/dehydratase family protein [Dothidotthia symphoricarpi CBS 119687]KAF2132507.1 NAD dependent epimerase/dehydratase family protein [Dothidotthia symphoricarpi CBS 119687]